MGPNMSKVNKNNQFEPKSWFNGSKNVDKVPKNRVGRHHFLPIFGHFWPFFGHLCTPRMFFSDRILDFG